MNLVFLTIFCLILSIIKSEFLDQTDDKSMSLNDNLNKNVRRRKLLYVVGVYPEWKDKIAAFKEKWGENGEKYMNNPNVYIHGDVPHDVVNLSQKNSKENSSQTSSDENKRRSNNINKYARRNNPNMIKNKLPQIIIRKEEINSDLLKPETENSNKKFNQLKEDFMRRKFNELDKLIKLKNAEYLEKKEKVENHLDDKNNEGNLENKDKVENYLDKKNIAGNLKKVENENNLDKNNNEDFRKFSNIDRIFDKIKVKYNVNKDQNDEIQRELNNDQNMLQKGWSRKSDSLTNVNNNEENRRYSNIDLMYAGLYPNPRNEDRNNIMRKSAINTDKIIPNNLLTKSENEGLNDNEEEIDRRFTNNAKINGKIHLKSTNENIDKKKIMRDPAEIIEWIKENIMPQIILQKKNTNIGSDENQKDEDDSIELIRETYPIIKVERKNNKKHLEGDINNQEEMKARKSLNSKLLDSKEEFLNRRLSSRGQQNNMNLYLKLKDVNEEDDEDL